jgi:hypothetical protein
MLQVGATGIEEEEEEEEAECSVARREDRTDNTELILLRVTGKLA